MGAVGVWLQSCCCGQGSARMARLRKGCCVCVQHTAPSAGEVGQAIKAQRQTCNTVCCNYFATHCHPSLLPRPPVHYRRDFIDFTRCVLNVEPEDATDPAARDFV